MNDPHGYDVSIAYNDATHLIVATVYVYPSPFPMDTPAFENQFALCKQAVKKATREAQLKAEASTELSQAGQRRNGKRAVFTFQREFFGKHQPVRSELYLFQHEKHFIKYRMTYPESQRSVAERLVHDFLTDLKWP